MDINDLKKYFVYLNKEYTEGEVYKIKYHFDIDDLKKVKTTSIFMTGFCVYDAYLNGEKIGDQLFKPGFTYYKRRLLYQEYDIKSMLKEKNELVFYVAQGWYCGRFFCENTVQNFGKLPSISFILNIEYDDGTKKIHHSEKGMKALISEYKYAGEYDGEFVDYSNENINQELGELSSFDFPDNVSLEKTLVEVKLQEEIKIVNVYAHDDYTIIDFGQNFAGIISINSALLNEGEEIVIRHGEILNNDGSLYTTNLRKAKATLSYKKGKLNHIYTPRFTYMGFRYIEVRGVKYVDGLLKAHAIYTAMNRTGYFTCSNPLIDRLYQNQVWGQKSNYVEVPTDCPQRDERLGYTGDGHVFALTGSYNFDTSKFWYNFFKDLAIQQLDNGDGNVSPFLPHPNPKPVGFMSMQGWGSAVSIIPEIMYEQYGDLDFFKNQLPQIKKYVDLEIKKAGNKYLWNAISLGDWLSLRKGIAWQAMNNHPVSNAFFINDLRILLKLLKILNKSDEYNYYKDIYNKVKSKYIKSFISKKGKVKKDYQGTYVLVLKHVLDENDKELRALVINKFVENVKKHGLDTGFFGTEHLLPLLVDVGEEKLAFDVLLSEKCPGWLYQVKAGATTTWERWDALKEDGTVNEEKSGNDNMVSFNHYSFGSVGEFYYQYILGIKPLEPGYKKIQIKPIVDKRIGNVSGSYLSKSGLISINYYYDNNQLIINIETPSPTTIILPNGDSYEVGAGKYKYQINI